MGVSDSLAAALKRQLLTNFPTTSIPKAADLPSSGMNPLVARFLEAVLDRHVVDEGNRISYDPSEWIPADRRLIVDESIREARRVIEQSVTFPASRWEYFIGLTSEQVCRYLVSPIDTLFAYIFPGDSDSVTSSSARKRLRSFGAYTDILDSVASSLPSDPDAAVRRMEFRYKLDEIARDVGQSISEWDDFCEPLFSLHEEVNGARLVPNSRLTALAFSLWRQDACDRMDAIVRGQDDTDISEPMLVDLMVDRADEETPRRRSTIVDANDSTDASTDADESLQANRNSVEESDTSRNQMFKTGTGIVGSASVDGVERFARQDEQPHEAESVFSDDAVDDNDEYEFDSGVDADTSLNSNAEFNPDGGGDSDNSLESKDLAESEAGDFFASADEPSGDSSDEAIPELFDGTSTTPARRDEDDDRTRPMHPFEDALAAANLLHSDVEDPLDAEVGEVAEVTEVNEVADFASAAEADRAAVADVSKTDEEKVVGAVADSFELAGADRVAPSDADSVESSRDKLVASGGSVPFASSDANTRHSDDARPYKTETQVRIASTSATPKEPKEVAHRNYAQAAQDTILSERLSAQPRRAANEPSGSGPVPLWKQFHKKLNAPMASDRTDTVHARTRAFGESTPDVSPVKEPSQSEMFAPSRPTDTGNHGSSRQSKADHTDRTERSNPGNRAEQSDRGDRTEHAEESVKPLWLRYQSKNAAPAAANAKQEAEDLSEIERRVFGRSDMERRNRFINELFDGSETSYTAVLKDIDAADEWSSASHTIAHNVFRRYRINIYSDVAVTFTNAVEQRFLK